MIPTLALPLPQAAMPAVVFNAEALTQQMLSTDSSPKGNGTSKHQKITSESRENDHRALVASNFQFSESFVASATLISTPFVERLDFLASQLDSNAFPTARPARRQSKKKLRLSGQFVGPLWRLKLSKLIRRSSLGHRGLIASVAFGSDRPTSGVMTADGPMTIDVNTVSEVELQPWEADFTQQCLSSVSKAYTAVSKYRLSVGDTTLGYVADIDSANKLAKRLEQQLRHANFSAEYIAPFSVSRGTDDKGDRASEFAVGISGRALFEIDAALSEAVGYSPRWAAISWANNLRYALGAAPLQPGETQMTLQHLQHSQLALKGEASWYGPYFHGRATANGETYNQNDLTVAHKSLPFGTQIKVRNLQNDKTVVVRVNDRGPYVGDRILDLSKAAADCLGSDQAGVIPVEATILKKAR